MDVLRDRIMITRMNTYMETCHVRSRALRSVYSDCLVLVRKPGKLIIFY